jgi:hypothetical protein
MGNVGGNAVWVCNFVLSIGRCWAVLGGRLLVFSLVALGCAESRDKEEGRHVYK